MANNPPKEKTEVTGQAGGDSQLSAATETRLASRRAPLEQTVLPQIPDHQLLRCIGRGSYGEVWLARNVMGTYRAVKIVYRKNFDNDRPYEREFDGIHKFEPISRSHDGLVDVLHVGRNDQAGYFYYVMELADEATSPGAGCSFQIASGAAAKGQLETLDLQPATYQPRTLQSDLKQRDRLSIEECIPLGLALTRALAYLHAQGLVHRDIKPSNIIFVKGMPKLADIGLVCGSEATRSYVGTEGFIPPEGPGTPQADIYSLGKVFYEMSTGKDRQEFPDLPTDLRASGAGAAELLEFNEVLVKACASKLSERYQTAQEMEMELALLESGKSIKQQRIIRRRWVVAKAAGAVAVVLLVMLPVAKLIVLQRNAAAVPEPKSIAVMLPFKNESSAQADEYLSDSLTREIMNRLKRIPVSKLKLIQMPVSMITNKADDVRFTLDQLSVPSLLEGRVQRSNQTLNIGTRLVSTADGRQLWSQAAENDMRDILNIPGVVAQQLAVFLGIELSAEETRQMHKKPTESSEAYENYLRARYYTHSERIGNVTNNDIAIPLLEHAVGLDTKFAAAFAELGAAYADRFFFYAPTEKEWETKAKFATERALSLDDTLAEAHFARAHFVWNPSQHFPHDEAVRELRKGLDLDPQSEEGFAWLALVYSHMGLLEETLQVAQQAHVVNPLDTRWRFAKGNALLWQGNFDEALKSLDEVPHGMQFIGGSYRAWARLQLGRSNDAAVEIRKLLERNPEDRGGLVTSVQAILHAKAGEAGLAQEKIDKAREQRKGFGHFHHTAYNIASAYALMGNQKEAIHWFKEAVEDGFNCYPLFEKDPNLDSLREIRDFKDLLAVEKNKHDAYKLKFGIGSSFANRK